jgi:hypothetical protein
MPTVGMSRKTKRSPEFGDLSLQISWLRGHAAVITDGAVRGRRLRPPITVPAFRPGTTSDLTPESGRTHSGGILHPGCEKTFTPRRTDQRHCRPACRKLAQRKSAATRLLALLERLNPADPGRPE